MSKNILLMAMLVGLALTGGAMAQALGQANGPAQLADTSKGKVLADAKGMTLYTFDKDADGKSACNGPCAANWPPFAATGAATPAGWTTITRDDGTKQWAYKGKPLYTFAKDEKPSEIKGDGFLNGAWHVVTP